MSMTTTFDNFIVGMQQAESLVKGLNERFAGVKPWNVELFGDSPDDNNALATSIRRCRGSNG